MPLFERYAEKQCDAQAKELLDCFRDPETYSFKLILLPMDVATDLPDQRHHPTRRRRATEWTDLYRTPRAAAMRECPEFR